MSLDSIPAEQLLRHRLRLRREFLKRPGLLSVRIAMLGGSTTNEVADLLELLLLDRGIAPTFYHSGFGRYFEEAVIDSAALVNFKPDVVVVYTSSVNLQCLPPVSATEEEFAACLAAEIERFTTIWNSLQKDLQCVVVQNNFEAPGGRLLGNLDCYSPGGHTRYINAINESINQEARSRPSFLINDLNSVAAQVGLSVFHDPTRWFASKLISSPAGSEAVARSLAALIASVYGRSRKCLVLDLDNTLWGGVIGDDGQEGIRIGTGTPEAEAYTDFQHYCLRLRERGIILAICSKNFESNALLGLQHPDSTLKPEHFARRRVNWGPKPDNLKALAEELNLGLDSMVFVDDNAAEREMVSAQLPMVAVPDVGDDVSGFIAAIEKGRYFETTRLSREDLGRAGQYDANRQRSVEQARFANYGEYLDSLQMEAEIGSFKTVYLDRIAQLINKTNQFNLTTRRYTLAEVQALQGDANFITLYGKLLDRFGDNGLVSVIIGRQEMQALHVDVWLMSCRVIGRNLEHAMLDALVRACQGRNITAIYGYYIASEKNALVAEHYTALGFTPLAADGAGRTTWKLPVDTNYVPRNEHIKELVHA